MKDSAWGWFNVPDQMWKCQQLAEGQRDEADPGRSGWGSAGHQLQELLRLLVRRSTEGSHFKHRCASKQGFLVQTDPPLSGIWAFSSCAQFAILSTATNNKKNKNKTPILPLDSNRTVQRSALGRSRGSPIYLLKAGKSTSLGNLAESCRLTFILQVRQSPNFQACIHLTLD